MINPGAALRAMRPVKSYTCQECGKAFSASDRRARYCSNACRQKVKYRKHRVKP